MIYKNDFIEIVLKGHLADHILLSKSSVLHFIFVLIKIHKNRKTADPNYIFR